MTKFRSFFAKRSGRIHRCLFRHQSLKYDSVISTCSHAVGSLSKMACAALLFLVVMAIANGDNPCLSLRVRSRPGCDMSSEMMTAC